MEKNQLAIYPINIEPLKEGGFFAECLVLEGCHAEGETLPEVIENIQDIIRIHIEARIKHGEIIPSIHLNKSNSFKINIPLPVLIEKQKDYVDTIPYR
tara:strand:+ start:1866 stop:2159 length:294 start_codon:yes stop_codon:yes gene_type:complete